MSPAFTSTRSTPRRSRRLEAIVWIFVAIVLCVLALAHFSIAILSSGRAYVGGEGLWSKGQKDAVYFLTRYTKTHDEKDFQEYLKALGVSLGDRRARQELEKAEPDLRVAHEGFVRGHNHYEDVEGMVSLFRRFRHVEFMEKAIDIWARADAQIDQLILVADELHKEVLSGHPNEVRLLSLGADIDTINARLTPLEDEFSYVLGEANRGIQNLLQWAVFAMAALMLIAGVVFSRRMLKQSEVIQNALEETEFQLRKVLMAAPVPIVMSRMSDSSIVFINERAAEQLRAKPEEILGQPGSRFYARPESRAEILDTLQTKGVVRESEIQLKDFRGVPFWVLLSSQKMNFMNEPCLLTAFNNFDARKHMQEEMQHRAYHDDLTNLPNRPMFIESLRHALARAQRHASTFSLLFIDLDHFKPVNDTLGHQVGDLLLREVARRLLDSVRKSDLVARLGGDEFVVLVEDQRDSTEVSAIANKILQTMAHEFSIGPHKISITVSMGISNYPVDGTDLNGLIRNADNAMYHAKQAGRNNFRFYAEVSADSEITKH